MTKKMLITLSLASSLIFGACIAKPANITTENPNVTLSGVISQTGTQFVLKTDTKIISLDSRQVNLSQSVGKTVTVTGQYSGTTLFVDKVE